MNGLLHKRVSYTRSVFPELWHNVIRLKGRDWRKGVWWLGRRKRPARHPGCTYEPPWAQDGPAGPALTASAPQALCSGPSFSASPGPGPGVGTPVGEHWQRWQSFLRVARPFQQLRITSRGPYQALGGAQGGYPSKWASSSVTLERSSSLSYQQNQALS